MNSRQTRAQAFDWPSSRAAVIIAIGCSDFLSMKTINRWHSSRRWSSSSCYSAMDFYTRSRHTLYMTHLAGIRRVQGNAQSHARPDETRKITLALTEPHQNSIQPGRPRFTVTHTHTHTEQITYFNDPSHFQLKSDSLKR